MKFNITLIPIISLTFLILISTLNCSTFTTAYSGTTTRSGEPEPITMCCSEENKSVDPGEVVTYDILLKNNLDVTLDVAFSFVSQDYVTDSLQIFAYNWSAGFPVTNITLTGQEQRDIVFQIGAPTYAIAGTHRCIEVRAIGYENFGMEYEATPISVTVLTGTAANMSVKAAPDSQWTVPGDDVNYTITITNEGNSDNIVDICICDQFPGWEYELSSSPSYLSPFEEIIIDLKVVVPGNASYDANPESSEIDPYWIGIMITGREKSFGINETTYVRLYIEGVSNFKLTAEKRSEGASPRSICDFIFRLDNLGNAIDVATLGITKNPVSKDWDMYFPYLSLNHKMDNLSRMSPINFSGEIDVRDFTGDVLYIPREGSFDSLDLKLGVAQSVYIAVHVRIPELRDVDNASFKVNSRTKDEMETIDNDLEFSIEIIMSDLYLIDEITRTNLEVGKECSFTATVGNKGELAAEDVRVTLYVDNKEVDSRSLPRIVVGDRKLVTFVWSASAGDHNIKVAVDPLDDIPEENEENNYKSMNIHINEPPVKKDKKSPGFEIIYLVVTLIILLISRCCTRKFF